jgi:hypothetical protein
LIELLAYARLASIGEYLV